MKRLGLIVTFLMACYVQAQDALPVKGLCIAAPSPDSHGEFVKFIDQELGPKGITTLILRIDYNYEYTSRPELRGDNPLTKAQIDQLVEVCQKHQIELIPQVNLLGHQSWHSKISKLLEVYPEFDETPSISLPENYEWPNSDGLYCKSYCPLHPEVHAVVFDIVDEIVAAFKAKTFHAGMDEVFYLAHPDCERCKGMDPAVLFANEVNKINNHLQENGVALWIWGDRLINGQTSGIGMWEASMNNTDRAIDLIDKSVLICDWHYEKAFPTPAYFAQKGFDVLACPWRKPAVAQDQVDLLMNLRANSTPKMKAHLQGTLHTVWSSADAFMKEYYSNEPPTDPEKTQAGTFKAMLKAHEQLGKVSPKRP